MAKCELPTVCVSGGFDPIHVGHLRMIQEAHKHGHVVVILNSDEWLVRKKGKPFMSFEDRKEIIMGLSCVEEVVMAKDDDGTVCESLKEIRPTTFCNGGDRKFDNTPEEDLCRRLGITTLYNVGGEKIRSSSEMVKNAVG